MKQIKDTKGFTLVELIVVLVILAVLAAILVPTLLGYIDKANEGKIIQNAEAARVAAQAEVMDMVGKGEYTQDSRMVDTGRKESKTGLKISDLVTTTGRKVPEDILKLAGIENEKCTMLVTAFIKNSALMKGTETTNETVEISQMIYSEDDKTAYFKDGSWVVKPTVAKERQSFSDSMNGTNAKHSFRRAK